MQSKNRNALDEALLRKDDRLHYDKVNMSFSFDHGLGGLLFTPEGAFVLRPKQPAADDLFAFFEGMEVGVGYV